METKTNDRGVELVKTQHVDSGTVQWVTKELYDKNTKLFKLVSGVKTLDEESEEKAQVLQENKEAFKEEVIVTEEAMKPSKPKKKPVQKGNTKATN